jgi:hypothetical protein
VKEPVVVRLRWLAKMQPPGSNEQRIMLEAAQELERRVESVASDRAEIGVSEVVAFLSDRDITLLPWQVARLSE